MLAVANVAFRHMLGGSMRWFEIGLYDVENPNEPAEDRNGTENRTAIPSEHEEKRNTANEREISIKGESYPVSNLVEKSRGLGRLDSLEIIEMIRAY
jgi:hypothetical protein